MNLKYKIPKKEEYPEVIDAVYQLFIEGKYHQIVIILNKNSLMFLL